MANRIAPKDVAKLVRAELKKNFGKIKFSVKTSLYAGGSSIEVRWTDGPTTTEVEKVIGHFHGADFDGMIDLKSSNGRPYGNDFIFTQRKNSAEAMQAGIYWYLQTFGNPAKVELVDDPYGAWVRTDDYEAQETIYRHVRQMAF